MSCKRELHAAVPEVSVIYVELDLPAGDAEVSAAGEEATAQSSANGPRAR